MDSVARNHDALAQASLNAERAFQAAFAPEYAHYPLVQRHTWAAAAILHCDILRYVVTFEDSTREGLVRLLWMGDIVSMLYEAREWFTGTGGPKLLEIATSRGYDTNKLRNEIKAMKRAYSLKGIDAFADYRNKVGHHYDVHFVTHLYEFSATDSDNFYAVLTNYAKFSNKWTALYKAVLAHNPQPNA